MSVLIVIPARYASTRYPGKPLVPLTGAGGVARTLIERSWRAAMAVDPESFLVCHRLLIVHSTVPHVAVVGAQCFTGCQQHQEVVGSGERGSDKKKRSHA